MIIPVLNSIVHTSEKVRECFTCISRIKVGDDYADSDVGELCDKCFKVVSIDDVEEQQNVGGGE